MPDRHANYRFAGFVLDVGERRLHAGDREVYLPPKTFETLLHLVERPGHLVTKSELLDAIWPGVAVTENALTRCIKEVRAALDDDVHAPRCVETVPRVGYRFIAPVEVVSPPPVSPSLAEPAPDGAIPALPAMEAEAPAPAPQIPDEAGALARQGAAATWGRRALSVAALTFLVLLVPVGSYLATPPGQTLGFGPRDFVVVTDLDNQTGESLFDRSLSTAFTSLLEQSRFANVFPRAGAAASLQRMGKGRGEVIDEEIGREICQREHIRGLVAVSIARVGAKYALAARLIAPPTGLVVRSRVEYADDRDGILDALRTLASGVRRDLGESLVSIRTADRPLERVTTSSLKALQLYSDGLALWDKGEHMAAVQLYQDAVVEDPGFAQAHAALGAAYYSFVFADPAKGKAHFEKAMALSERVSDREQRGIRLAFEHQQGHWETAYDLYRGYLQRYPDDFRIRYNFGNLLRSMWRWDEAIGQYQEVLRVAPNHTSAHVNLATSCTPGRRYAEALRHWERAFEIEPSLLTTGNLNHEYGFALVRAGNPGKAREVFAKGLSSSVKAAALRSLAFLDMYDGKYRQAQQRLGEAIQLNAANGTALNEARTRLFLAMALNARGLVADSRRELVAAAAKAGEASAAPWVLGRIGVEMARAGAVREAGDVLQQVLAKTDQRNPEQVAELRRLEGEVALAGGDRQRAAERLTLDVNVRLSAFSVASLARFHRLTGDQEKASGLYEQLLGMDNIALGFEPQEDWLTAHYWMANLSLAAGNPEKAKHLSGTLLEKWREGDPDLPMLVRTKALAAEAGKRTR
jgi:DNA-binding winged helix-turn-helix (wHTH) protein/tetratricopeptide (TPR) repeat protein